MRSFTKLGLGLGLAALLGGGSPAQAANSSIEMTIRSYGDLTMFYQALLNTGVVNELNENTHYTIFAPVDSSFATLPPQNYPCFYSVQCRPQIAGLLRNHILSGEHDLDNLVSYGSGIRTTGSQPVHVTEPYVGEYDVDGHRILSKTEVNGNFIYRISGFIATPQEMAQFQTAAIVPAADTVTTRRTVTQKNYHRPDTGEEYPAGDMVAPAEDGGNVSETTTIIQRTTTGPDY